MTATTKVTAHGIDKLLLNTYPKSAPIILQVLHCEQQKTPQQNTILSITVSDSIKSMIAIIADNIAPFADMMAGSLLLLKKFLLTKQGTDKFLMIHHSQLLPAVPIIGQPISIYKDATSTASKPSIPSNITNSSVNNNRNRPLSTRATTAIPVKNLSPMIGRDWFSFFTVIQKRNPEKKGMNHFGKQTIVGSLILRDDHGGLIAGTMFGEYAFQLAEKFEVGKRYKLTHAGVKNASKFNIGTNAHELSLDEKLEVEPADSVAATLDMCDFDTIEAVSSMSNYSPVNVFVILKSVGELASGHKKDGTPWTKRELVICDSSMYTVGCALWNPDEDSKYEIGSVLKIAGQKTDFNNCSITIIDCAIVDPEIVNMSDSLKREYEQIRAWWGGLEDKEHGFTNLTENKFFSVDVSKQEFPLKTCADVFAEKLGENGKEFFSIKARIMAFSENVTNEITGPWISTCPNQKSGKKHVLTNVNDPSNMPRCETCGPIASSDLKAKYCVYLKLQDLNSEQGISGTVWDEEANKIFTDDENKPVKVDELKRAFFREDGSFTTIMQRALTKQAVFKMSVAKDEKNSNSSYSNTRNTIHKIENVQDYVTDVTANLENYADILESVYNAGGEKEKATAAAGDELMADD